MRFTEMKHSSDVLLVRLMILLQTVRTVGSTMLGIKFQIPSQTLTDIDGYCDIYFPDNNPRMIVRSFKDTNGTSGPNRVHGSITDINYCEYTIPSSYLDAIS